MKDKTKKFAIGAVVAAVAGYIAGILTAPKSGKQTRKDIKDQALKTKSEAEKKLKQLHSELDDLLNQAKSSAHKLQKEAGESFATVVAEAQFAKEKVRGILSALHDGYAEDTDLQNALDQASAAIKDLKGFLVKKNNPK